MLARSRPLHIAARRSEAPSEQIASAVLAHVLDRGLRLLHPWMPFITETLWQRLPNRDGAALIAAHYPQPGDGTRDADAEAQFGAVQEIVRAVRQTRADYNVQAGRWVESWVVCAEPLRAAIGSDAPAIETLARSRPLHIAASRDDAPSEQIASAVLPDAEVVIPLGGLVDLEQERRRLEKELSQVEGRLKGAEAKLANEGFRSKAPPEVVRQAEELAAELERRRAALAERIGSLA